MIQIKEFSIGFGKRKLLENISTSFAEGKLTAIIGRNGAGKSTMMKAICNLNKDYDGEILIDNEKISNIPPNKLATKIAYVNTQRPRMANLKCKDIIALGRTPYTGWYGNLTDKDNEIIEKSLELVGMSDYKDRAFNSLSDGESQKIMIARAIAQDTEIIILDEPTSFLDLPTRYELVRLLKKLANEEGKTVIYSTHELDLAIELSDRIALIDKGDFFNLPTQEFISQNLKSRLLPSH